MDSRGTNLVNSPRSRTKMKRQKRKFWKMNTKMSTAQNQLKSNPSTTSILVNVKALNRRNSHNLTKKKLMPRNLINRLSK